MAGVTYDPGGLVAAERNDRTMWQRHSALIEAEIVPVVPAPVLAQAWRGGSRQGSLARFLGACEVEPMTEELARSVGVLAGRAGHHDIVDVAVVEGAIRRGDAIVTADAGDIRKVTAGAGVHLRIERV
jgi:hypothetical protein